MRRSPKYRESAIQFCVNIKSLFNLALRHAMGMVQGLLKLADLDWEVPEFSLVSRRQSHLTLTIDAHDEDRIAPAGRQHHFKILGEGEWKTKKHGTDYRRQWRKVHLYIDASMLEIRAIGLLTTSPATR